MSLDRVDLLAQLLSAASGVQTFLGVGDSVDAYSAIIQSGHAVPDDWTRPAILLSVGSRARQLLVAGGGAQQFGEEATPVAIFERDMVDPSDPEESCIDFANYLGAAMEDVRNLAGTGSYPRLRAIRLESPIQVSDFDETADYCQAMVAFEWGTP